MAKPRFQWLIYTAVLLLIVAVITIGVIATGVFDPSPFGPSLWRMELQPMTIKPTTRQINWLAKTLPEPPFTVRLSAAYNSGEIDSGYGMVVGDEDHYLAVAVSSLGYLAIWETREHDSYHLDWQTWPHVRKNSEANEIWLDIERDRARLRINREWLWESEVDPVSNNIGILGESFGGDAVVDFESLEIFAETDN